MKQFMIICLMAITVFSYSQKKSLIQANTALDSLDKAIQKDHASSTHFEPIFYNTHFDQPHK